jgi:very-short-patch-repair endonuclease
MTAADVERQTGRGPLPGPGGADGGQPQRPPAPLHDLAELPAGRVTQVLGASADDIAATLARVAPELPLALIHRIHVAPALEAFVTDVLDDLESVVVDLFPAWLPGAERITVSAGAGLAAVRAVAADHARRSAQSAPFLCDLAATALAGRATGRRRFPPGVRAPGLIRVIADALRCPRLVLIMEVPAGLSARGELMVAAGCEWLAERGPFGVWLTGVPLATVDRFGTVTLTGLTPATGTVTERSTVVGAPHPRSTAEAVLEASLATHAWAGGRRWNQTYQSDKLRTPVRLDLIWPDERCIVEIDGPEHCEPVKFDADRRRDVQLQLDGYAVLRFTNARVLHDVQAVAAQIGQFINARRCESGKGREWPTTT